MTSRIYYTDPYCRRFDAVVTKAFDLDRRPAVMLDRTAFYPTSGGQPFDTGRLAIVRPAGGGSSPRRLEVEAGDVEPVHVLETIDANDQVIHVLSAPLAEGMAVRGDIDWDRRFDHMQQHTGQHVLSAAFDRLFDNRTIGFHMGGESATIDLESEASWEQIGRAEDDANRVVWEDREVSIRFISPGASTGALEAMRLRKAPTREGVLRVIEVKDFDLSACGGTHVARTGAIGAIAIAGAERFKGGTRVTFACGARALRVFRTLRESVAGSVRALSVLPRELPDAIQRLQSEGKELRRTLKKFQESLAQTEAERLTGSARLAGPHAVPIVIEALDGWDANGLKSIASAIVARTQAAVALFSTSSPTAVVIARSAGVPIDANAVLRALIQRFGGRGGGTADLAQGGGLAGPVTEMQQSAGVLLIADSS